MKYPIIFPITHQPLTSQDSICHPVLLLDSFFKPRRTRGTTPPVCPAGQPQAANRQQLLIDQRFSDYFNPLQRTVSGNYQRHFGADWPSQQFAKSAVTHPHRVNISDP